MNHHRPRQFLREMAPPKPLRPTDLQPPSMRGISEQRDVSSCKAALNLRTGSKDSPETGLHNTRHPAFSNPLARDLFALGAEAMIAQAKAADLDRNVRAAVADEAMTEGRPFPVDRVNPHGE